MSGSILITGGAGNVGSALATALWERTDCKVVVVDSLLTGSRSKLPEEASSERFTFVRADVNQLEEIGAVFAAHRPSHVFHYAAVVGVRRTLENPLLVLRDIQGIRNVLDLAKAYGVERVFYSSSSEVYGEPVEIPQVEDTTPLNSRLPYAVVKNVGEVYLKTYHQEYGLPYTIFRFFNTYGPRQTTDFVISRFVELALREQPLTVHGDGQQTRTFCYVDDNVECTLKTLHEGHARNDTLNVGSDEEISVLDLAHKVTRILGSSSKVVHLPPLAEGDMRRRRPDITKMRRILERPLVTLEEGIGRTAESMLRKMRTQRR